jgi:hypothetical protein
MAMKKLSITTLLIFVFLIYNFASAEDGIVVNLRIPEHPWADSHLGEKLDTYLSAISHVPIIRYDINDSILAASGESFQDLLTRGQMQKGHYLVDIRIDRIGLDKKKMTVFPMILSRYRVYATLTGTLRILDINRERMVKVKKIDYEVKASDQWQLVDDNEYDPDLSISPDEKILLFDRLEDETASRLFKEIKELTRGNSFGR